MPLWKCIWNNETNIRAGFLTYWEDGQQKGFLLLTPIPFLFSRTLKYLIKVKHVLKSQCMNWPRVRHAFNHPSEQNKQAHIELLCQTGLIQFVGFINGLEKGEMWKGKLGSWQLLCAGWLIFGEKLQCSAICQFSGKWNSRPTEAEQHTLEANVIKFSGPQQAPKNLSKKP